MRTAEIMSTRKEFSTFSPSYNRKCIFYQFRYEYFPSVWNVDFHVEPSRHDLAPKCFYQNTIRPTWLVDRQGMPKMLNFPHKRRLWS
jgi:hypothetical protein